MTHHPICVANVQSQNLCWTKARVVHAVTRKRSGGQREKREERREKEKKRRVDAGHEVSGDSIRLVSNGLGKHDKVLETIFSIMCETCCSL